MEPIPPFTDELKTKIDAAYEEPMPQKYIDLGYTRPAHVAEKTARAMTNN